MNTPLSIDDLIEWLTDAMAAWRKVNLDAGADYKSVFYVPEYKAILAILQDNQVTQAERDFIEGKV